jgi:hypothetical protein
MIYLIYIFNLIVQDILKIIIKNDYNSLNERIIYNIEKNKNENINNKFFNY